MRTSIVLLLVFGLVFALSCGQQADDEMEQTEMEKTEEMEVAANTAIDPICDMKVNKDTAQYVAEHNGEKYYFCMEEHKVTFLEDPEAYLMEEK